MLAQPASERPEKSHLPLLDQITDPLLDQITDPLLDQITDHVGHLLDRHGRIDVVLIEQVDIVGAKPAPGVFCHLMDMLRPTVPVDADLLIALETKPSQNIIPIVAPKDIVPGSSSPNF
jgi:hypothetical protein